MLQEELLPLEPTRARAQVLSASLTGNARTESYDYRAADSAAASARTVDDAAARRALHHRQCVRWMCLGTVGALVALVALAVNFVTGALFDMKLSVLDSVAARSRSPGGGTATSAGLASTLAAYGSVSVLYAVVAAALIAYFAPQAAGSGIPEVKAALNGVNIPGMQRGWTVAVKALGLVGAVASGLPLGREGPLVFIGAGLAASATRGRRRTCGRDTSWTVVRALRNDAEKRDMAACGAAAGVAAAFGAPIGGVLFVLEEGASHWFRELLWRAFFCAVVCTWLLAVVSSGVAGHWGAMSTGGLFDLGSYAGDAALLTWQAWELPLFIATGALGGMLGAVMVAVQRVLGAWRARVLPASRPAARVAEVACLVLLMIAVKFVLAVGMGTCERLPAGSPMPPPPPASLSQAMRWAAAGDQPPVPSQRLFCADGEYNDLASLLFVPGEAAIRLLFHFPDAFAPSALAALTVAYFVLLCLTFGAAVPGGIFIPALLTGSGLGRLGGQLLLRYLPGGTALSPGLYALIGAAAVLGGVTRMTISLAVILMETTGNVAYALPLITTLLAARATGNVFGSGLYDLVIELRGWPVLVGTDEADELSLRGMRAGDIMASPPITLREVEHLGALRAALASTHHAWPLLYNEATLRAFPSIGSLAGIIARRELAALVAARARGELALGPPSPAVLKANLPAAAAAANAAAQAAAELSGIVGAVEPLPPTTPTPRGRRFLGAPAHSPLRLRVPATAAAPALPGSASDLLLLADVSPALAAIAEAYPNAPEEAPVPADAASAVGVRDDDDECVDLRAFLNPTPVTVHVRAPAARAAELFRALGLRHLLVIDDGHNCVGVITRKDVVAAALHARKRALDESAAALAEDYSET